MRRRRRLQARPARVASHPRGADSKVPGFQCPEVSGLPGGYTHTGELFPDLEAAAADSSLPSPRQQLFTRLAFDDAVADSGNSFRVGDSLQQPGKPLGRPGPEFQPCQTAHQRSTPLPEPLPVRPLLSVPPRPRRSFPPPSLCCTLGGQRPQVKDLVAEPRLPAGQPAAHGLDQIEYLVGGGPAFAAIVDRHRQRGVAQL